MKSNRIKQLLKSKPVSMKEFLKKVGEFATANNQNYYCVRCDLTQTSTKKVLVYSCYVHGCTWHSDETPEGALAKLKASREVSAEKAIAADVFID